MLSILKGLAMKKMFGIYALILAIILMHPVNAETIKSKPLKNHPDLIEIVLNKEETFETPENKIIATNISSAESSLEYKNKPQEKGFFSIFNLQGGVEKSNLETPPTGTKTEETFLHNWLNGNYATGDWLGARSALENHGVTINSSMMYSPFGKIRGGMADQVKSGGYSLYNLSVTVDTEKAGLWKGGTFYALYQNKRGGGISGTGGMGDYQMLDNYDFREMNQISEAWYQQKLFKDKLRLKFGKQDANFDFCSLGRGFDFLNLSFSVIPTVPLPTYPDQSFGFVAEVSPTKWMSLKNGTYSRYNVPFNISEIELKPTIKKMPGKYMLGVWELSDSNGMNVATSMNAGNIYYNNFNRNFGAYAAFEQIIYKEQKDNDDDMQGLAVFGQFGISPSNRNDMSRYTGGGLHYKGPFPKRDKDIAGIGVASGNFASRLGDITSQVGSETAIECFYRVQITPWFYLQPDIQFIMNPGGLYNNSIAFGIRSFISF